MKIKVLLCPNCGRTYNPETYNGINCEESDCGRILIIATITWPISNNGDKPDEEKHLIAS